MSENPSPAAPSKESPLSVLKSSFGYDQFRPGQEEIIESILAGRDVCAIMPTGAGKSLCFQVPALLLGGLTVVISPLISLMKDQVGALLMNGVAAAFVNSTLDEGEIRQILLRAQAGALRLLYMAPERFSSAFAANLSRTVPISLIAVDEAHCISQWGQDFRPDYKRIPDFVSSLPVRPILAAFTATATVRVREDILQSLALSDPYIHTGGFDRPNLYFSVENLPSPPLKTAFIEEELKKNPGEAGIIYCATRKAVDELYGRLLTDGFSVSRYHAGLSPLERRESQEDFINDRTSCMIATNAFGMGIDKSDVRFVIHYNLPGSLENYYQEAGRAGRDQEPARCTLLYSEGDVQIQRFLITRHEASFEEALSRELLLEQERSDRERLAQMQAYALSGSCLRSFILSYFGETPGASCDNCAVCCEETTERDISAFARQIFNCVYETRQSYGSAVIAQILAGVENRRAKERDFFRLRTFGRLKELSVREIQHLIEVLLSMGYLFRTPDRYPLIRLTDKVNELKDPGHKLILRERIQKPVRLKSAARRREETALTETQQVLLGRLRVLRASLARQEGVPPFMIFGDRTLRELCVSLPQSREEFLRVYGIGERKADQYGPDVTREILRYMEEFRVSKEAGPGGETVAQRALPSGKSRSSGAKKPPVLSPEDLDRLNTEEEMTAPELARRIVSACSSPDCKLYGTQIQALLEEKGLFAIEKGDDQTPDRYLLSPEGLSFGLSIRENTARSGKVYQTLLFSRQAQLAAARLYLGS